MPYAVVADAFGPPETYEFRELQAPLLEAGQARVAIRAVGISFVDVLIAAGGYQLKPPLPFIPGSEAAGVVIETGSAVGRVAVGDRVVCRNFGGLFAQQAVLPESSIQRVPQAMELIEAAVFPVSYATAWHALVDRAQVRSGETVLVLGAGGATGYAAVQVAKHLGARVIGAASSEEKQALALAGGADAVVPARGETWREQLREAACGAPVDVVFDPVGGEATEAAFRSLGWRGRHLVIGFPAGMTSLKTNLPLLKGASLMGVDIRQFGEREPELAQANRTHLFDLAAAGILKPHIARTYRLQNYVAAMREASSGESAGRIVLTVDGPG
jgi:NADPH2:quinone reductase